MKNPFLDSNWLDNHYKKIVAKAGNRYTPKLNVELPFSKVFDSLARTKEFYEEIQSHYGKLSRKNGKISPKEKADLLSGKDEELYKVVKNLEKILVKIKHYDTSIIPWKKILHLSENANELAWQLRGAMYKVQENEKAQTTLSAGDNEFKVDNHSNLFSSEIYTLTELEKELRFFSEFAKSKKSTISNTPFMSLEGQSGIGKTHLLCDLTKNRLENKYPTVMVFGHDFGNSTDVWSQIITQLKLKPVIKTKEELLSHLNSAGLKANCKSVLIIDALNETVFQNYWIRNVPKIIKDTKPYKNIALIVSVRSGFEKEVYPSNIQNLLTSIPHEGFTFREWQAVVTFFKEYGIPLTDIPILSPEFQIPLFLKLFCEGVGQRLKKRKKKQSYKGHEGATFIFESFVKYSADKIAKEFGLPKGKNSKQEYVIWDTVIEKIAEVMVRKRTRKDVIYEPELKRIIRNAHPEVDASKMVQSLERHTLITQIPIYSPKSEKSRHGFIFPYQKFSDHLICRYLLKKYNPKNRKFRQFFYRKNVFGKLFKSHNRGLLEALAVQIPERTNGRELFEFFPRDKGSYLIKETFIESLIWRIPTRFRLSKSGKPIKVANYVNKYIIQDDQYFREFLNAVISVSTNQYHPFNAKSLDAYLQKLGIKKRDAFWSTFLHYENGENKAVDRIIAWAWSMAPHQQIEKETVELAAITLTWFLSSTNHFVRDRATKALVALLTNNLDVTIKVLKKFEKIDDPYIHERLFAVAYGGTLRSDSTVSKNLKKLAEYVYEQQFKQSKPTPHLLLRDYALGIIKEAIRRGERINIDASKIEHPFISDSPDVAPEVDDLKKTYYPDGFKWDEATNEGRGIVGIWRSLMYASDGGLADFGNYELGSALGYWSATKLTEPKPLSREEKENRFLKSLNQDQKDLYKKTKDLEVKNISIIIASYTKDKDDEILLESDEKSKKKLKKISSKLLKSFSKKQFEKYSELSKSNQSASSDRFNNKLAERWMLNKIMIDLYDPTLHGDFDSNVQSSRDRGAPKIERIGKKYQWIAMHELLARISDNYRFKGAGWSDKISKYKGAWQTFERNIDPSFVISGEVKKLRLENLWWIGSNYKHWDDNLNYSDWLKKRSDLPPVEKIILVSDPSGKEWLNLSSLISWEPEHDPSQEEYGYSRRRLSYILKSFIVRSKDKKKFVAWLKKQKDFYNHTLPSSLEIHEVFFREYPYSEAFNSLYGSSRNDWSKITTKKSPLLSVLCTNAEYSSSFSSSDGSQVEGVNISMPSRWLCEKMNLDHGMVEGEFINKQGDVIFQDPAVSSNSHSTLLGKKESLLTFLKSRGYDIIWTVLGEKQVLGDSQRGYTAINGVYYFDKTGKLGGTKKIDVR